MGKRCVRAKRGAHQAPILFWSFDIQFLAAGTTPAVVALLLHHVGSVVIHDLELYNHLIELDNTFLEQCKQHQHQRQNQ